MYAGGGYDAMAVNGGLKIVNSPIMARTTTAETVGTNGAYRSASWNVAIAATRVGRLPSAVRVDPTIGVSFDEWIRDTGTAHGQGGNCISIPAAYRSPDTQAPGPDIVDNTHPPRGSRFDAWAFEFVP